MPRTKISEFSSTAANNTDIDSINIAENCPPSSINDAIRELMAQLKDFQTGAVGDSFNGPIGTSTAAAGAFTTLSATGAITSTLATGTAPLVIASTTKVANLNVDLLDGADWAAPAALGSTTPAAVSATTLAASGAVTLSGGTANGVAYLNGSKVVTSGSALTFDGTKLSTSTFEATGSTASSFVSRLTNASGDFQLYASNGVSTGSSGDVKATIGLYYANTLGNLNGGIQFTRGGGGTDGWMNFFASGSEQMRLTSTGLGIGTSSPVAPLHVYRASSSSVRIDTDASASTTQLNFAIAGTNKWSLYRPTSSNDLRLFDNATAIDVMTWQVGGNVGIGTTSIPTSKLEVIAPSTSFTSPQMLVGNSSSQTTGQQLWLGYNTSAGAGFIQSVHNGTAYTSLVINPNGGNLGLGVTPSAWSGYKAFQVGVGSADGAFIAAGNDTNVTTNAYFNAGWKYQTSSNLATMYKQTSGAHQWHTAPSGTAGNAITFTQALTLDSGGSLLIGDTSAPTNGLTSAALSTKGQGTGGSRRATASSMGVTSSLAQNATANTYSFGGYGGYGLFVAEGGDPNAAWRAAAIIWSTGAALTVLNLGSSNITVGSSGTTVTVQNTSASSQAISWSMLVLG